MARNAKYDPLDGVYPLSLEPAATWLPFDVGVAVVVVPDEPGVTFVRILPRTVTLNAWAGVTRLPRVGWADGSGSREPTRVVRVRLGATTTVARGYVDDGVSVGLAVAGTTAVLVGTVGVAVIVPTVTGVWLGLGVIVVTPGLGHRLPNWHGGSVGVLDGVLNGVVAPGIVMVGLAVVPLGAAVGVPDTDCLVTLGAGGRVGVHVGFTSGTYVIGKTGRIAPPTEYASPYMASVRVSNTASTADPSVNEHWFE